MPLSNQLMRYRVPLEDRVPEDYYSITEILSTNKIHESPKVILKWRQKTVGNVLTLMQKEGELNIKKWWIENINLSDVELAFSSDVILFMKNTYLAKAIKLVEVFIERVNPPNRKKQGCLLYVSFGIKKQWFKDFFESGGTIVPDLQRRRGVAQGVDSRIRDNDKVKVADSNRFVEVHGDALYRRWKDWCKLKGYESIYAIADAMRDQIESDPADELPEESEYLKYVRPKVFEKKQKVGRQNVPVDRDVMYEANQIVQAYNERHLYDKEGPMTQRRYVKMAVCMLNDIMGKEYLHKDELEDMQKQIEALDEQMDVLMNQL